MFWRLLQFLGDSLAPTTLNGGAALPYETIVFEREGDVAIITLNRPDALNSLTWELMDETGEALAQCASDGRVRAVVITGSGKAFCAGVDVKAVTGKAPEEAARFLYQMADGMHERVIGPIRHLGKPVITAINGVAAGGGLGLALSGDIVVASDQARFALAYANVGMCPDCGTSFFLPRLVGQARAMELYLLNEILSAEQARQLGIVSRVVPGATLLAEARDLASRLAKGPTLAYAQAKRLFNRAFANDLNGQLIEEGMGIGVCAASEDGREGMQAFADKRAPRFVGR